MTTRQELYDRIRSSSKDEVILEEMIRLGFWPRGGALPEDPAEEIRRRGELERELRALTSENSRLQNAEAIKNAMRKQRMEESRRKRQENKERRLRERQERAEAWRQRKRAEIGYLGDGVSAGLGQQESNEEKLAKSGLPLLKTAADMASAMEIGVGELRFLAFSRRTSTVTPLSAICGQEEDRRVAPNFSPDASVETIARVDSAKHPRTNSAARRGTRLSTRQVDCDQRQAAHRQ